MLGAGCRLLCAELRVCTGRGGPEPALGPGVGVPRLLDKPLVLGWPLTSLPSPLKWKEISHLANPRRGQGGTHHIISGGPFQFFRPVTSLALGLLAEFTLLHVPSSALRSKRTRPAGHP